MNSKNTFMQKHFSLLSDRLFFLTGLLMLCSEIWKQITLTFVVGSGTYDWWYFPFQLCSIPMYLLLVYPWCRKEKLRCTILEFLMCYGLMGGIAVFADQSGLQYPLPALTFHSYSWHILLIAVGISAGFVCIRLLPTRKILFSRQLSRKFPLTFFLRATGLYLICCLTAEVLNITLDSLGTINLFYINPDYQMQQVIFRDLVPLTGNLPCIILYITASVIGAFFLHLIWTLVFRLSFYSHT